MTTAIDSTAIRVRGVIKRFAKFTLGPLDLTVPTGAVYGLIGPNGAGKTTLLDLMMGMGAEDAGEIEMFGLDHHRDEVAVKLRTGYVSPELSYVAWGYIDRAIHFVRKFYPTWDQAYCEQLLRRFELKPDEKIATLSLGNKTRLALVLALSHRPDLLILDEPTTGLDAVAKLQFFEEMMALMQDERRTVLISSHGLADVERYADHIGMIAGGQLLLEGSTSDLLERYRLLDVRMLNGTRADSLAGVRVLRREGERVRLLFDQGARAPLPASLEILSETPLTLEELFVALVAREEQAA